MNDKQQQLLFDKGITNVPSDAICSDNALSECVGLTYENGEHRVIQKPKVFMTSVGGDILYVHEFDSQERYICLRKETRQHGGVDYTVYVLSWRLKGSIPQSGSTIVEYVTEERPPVSVTSIGKTLIVSDDENTKYYLWKTDSYESLGSSFPRPDVEFMLGDRNETDMRAYESVTASGIYWDSPTWYIDSNKQEDWNNTVIGLYTKLRKRLWQKKAFVGSFCVRAALELYDGSYYHIENPVFMLNHFSAYCVAYIQGTLQGAIQAKMEVFGQHLYYRFRQDYTKWSDIIKNVVLFVTREANLFDMSSDAILQSGSASPHASEPVNYFMSANRIYADESTVGTHTSIADTPFIVLDSNANESLKDIIHSGVYYKLCDIGLIGNSINDDNWHDAGEHFDTHTIENISTQTQLGDDDYFSHCSLKAEMLYAYNSRLNLANVSRSFFEGFDNFMPFDHKYNSESANPSSNYTFYTTIRTDGGDVVVSHEKTTTQYQGIYFYYPDPRAIHVVIKKGSDYILDKDLTEHPTLHGAYYFAGVSPDMEEPDPLTGGYIPTVVVTTPTPFEVLPNYVIQSEVNNPFVFKAAGYFKVGTGKILGMSSITQALSEGQFGQYPLLVFSDKGIWALSVASTGYYDSIHPISREVCNNPTSITQTDGAVYFTSAKGLMVVVGSQVKCVSEQMSGRTSTMKVGNTELVSDLGHFCDYLKTCFIAYDYRDSLLWIFKGSGSRYCYIYSIKSGTFSKYDFGSGNTVTNTVSNYPDYLIQVGTNAYTLNGRDNINLDPSSYSGSFITRPMKLENAMVPKTIMDIRNIKTFTPYGTPTTTGAISLAVYGSNNLFNWVQLKSLRGLPWKYYRFKYTFSGLKAVDRFAGCVVRMQERRRLTK